MHYYLQPNHIEIAKKNGIPYNVVYRRFYDLGWNLERAITEPIRKRSTHNWEKWKDVAKVSKDTYFQRVRNRGWDEERAALTPPLKRHQWRTQKSVFTKEQEMKMKENNIPYHTAYMRYKRLGWTREEAVTTPVMTKEESLKRAREGSSWKDEKKFWCMRKKEVL